MTLWVFKARLEPVPHTDLPRAAAAPIFPKAAKHIEILQELSAQDDSSILVLACFYLSIYLLCLYIFSI